MPWSRKQDAQQGRPSLFKRLASRCHGLLDIVVVSGLWGFKMNTAHQASSEANSAIISEHRQEPTPPPPSPPMTAFDLVVVGAGGGPDETNLSA
jgi:hypothetical protein